MKYEQDESLTPIEGGWIDGYLVGERVLEGVMFHCTVNPEGTDLLVRVRGSDYTYFNNLAKKKWLAAVRQFALTNDVFSTTAEGTDDDVVLYDHDKSPREQQFGCPTPVVLNTTV